MDHRAVCFVIMPFGRKPDSSGRIVDFDRIHADVIAPAVEAAGLAAIRADEEKGAGFIHKLMYERILLSEFAIADLTILNANVYYELGIRHATRPETTVLTMALGAPLPFDVGPLRALPYALGDDGAPIDAAAAAKALTERLTEARGHRAMDSPLFQLLEGYQAAPIDRLKTDVFRTQVAYAETLKKRLAEARASGVEALDALRDGLGDIGAAEAGVAVDLLLSYRALSQWRRVVELCEKLDRALQRTVLVREQWAMALNQLGRDREAEATLTALIGERGPSSETCGLLGRIHKDRWEKARQDGRAAEARGHLRKAIAAYRQGFESDWRDAYPGVNAATLMTIADPHDRAAKEIAAVARYAARQRLAPGADLGPRDADRTGGDRGRLGRRGRGARRRARRARRKLEGRNDRGQPQPDRRGARGGRPRLRSPARHRRRARRGDGRRRLTPRATLINGNLAAALRPA